MQSHDPTDFYEQDLSALPLADRDSLPQPTLGELYRAGRDLATDDRSNAERDRIRNAYAPILEVLNDGRPRRIWRTDADDRHAYTNPGQWSPRDETGSDDREREEALIWAEIARRRQADPSFLPGVPATLDEFHKRIGEAAVARRNTARGTLDRNQSWLGSLAGLAGGAVESFDDPATLATLPVGGGGRTIAQRIIIEGVANAGVEAAQQPTLAKRRADLGETLTAGEAVANVAIAGALGSGVQGAILEPAGAMFRRARARIAKNGTPAERAAVTLIDREDEVAAASPFRPGADTDEHVTRLASARARLNGQAGTREKPISVDPAARSKFKGHVRAAESSGNDAARPIDPATGKLLSSAMGRYQFTDGTWLTYYRRRFGSSESRDAILAKKRDGAIQEVLMDDLTADNARALARIGAPETAGNLYLMHFLGEAGARRTLKASPDTPIAQVVSGKAIASNRRVLYGKTAGEVIAWAHARMDDAVPSTPRLRPELFESDAELAVAQREIDAEDATLARLDQDGAGLDAEIAAARERSASRERGNDAEAFDPDEQGLGVILKSPAVKPRGRPGYAVETVADGLGHAVYRDSEGVARGALVFPVDASRASEGLTVFVRRDDRRQGIATRLYETAAAAGYDVERLSGAGYTTVDGAAFVTGRRAKSVPAPVARAASRKAQKPAKPRDLIRFLAERGGVRDDEGHDLIRGRGLQRFIPGKGNLIRKTGMTLDEAREAAAEAGYFVGLTPDEAWSGTTTADFLDLWEEGHRSPVYARGDLSDVIEREAEEAWRLGEEERAFYEAEVADMAPQSLDESLEHDVRMFVAENPDATIGLGEGVEVRLSDALDDLDADAGALRAARACMVPPARAA